MDRQWRRQDLVPGGEGHIQSYWVFTLGKCRYIVAVRLCIGQSALKKINCCKSKGNVPQCPIVGDANVDRGRIFKDHVHITYFIDVLHVWKEVLFCAWKLRTLMTLMLVNELYFVVMYLYSIYTYQLEILIEHNQLSLLTIINHHN